jgi:phospholipase C
LLIVTYDEHGGFFDHVAPLAVRAEPPPGADFTNGFTSTGVRVPALLLSPYAPQAGVAHAALDHTSILQMIAERFDPTGAPFSEAVDARRADGIGSVTGVLSPNARTDVPRSPTKPIAATVVLATDRGTQSLTSAQTAFAAGVEGFAKQQGPSALQKYPDITHWLATRQPA